MRIWSLHPEYLDAKGIVALWRETLLAKKVLENKTRGYKNHPQLIRFKNSQNPLSSINFYLSEIFFEAERRNYSFDISKIDWKFLKKKMKVTEGQMEYELNHLKRKLKIRDQEKWKEISSLKKIKPHPLFQIEKGGVEVWEII